MKGLIIALGIVSSSVFACPQINLSNLTCRYSDGSQAIIESFVVSGNTMFITMGGENRSTQLPHNENEGNFRSKTYCDGNRIGVVEFLEDKTALKYIEINNGSLRVYGEEIVPGCDYPQGCDNNEYWIDSIDSVDFTCS